MKKIVSLVLALVLICALAVTAAAADFSVSTDAAVVEAGQTVTVTVSLSETIPAGDRMTTGATMFQGELYYDDDALEPVSVSAGSGYSFLTCVISSRYPRVQFNWSSDTSTSREFPAGTVVTVEFQVKEDLSADHLTSQFSLDMSLQNAAGGDVIDSSTSASVVVCKEHTWNGGEETTAPTCVKEGVKTYTCTYNGCGATKTETVAATGEHVWDAGKVTTEPGCVTTGVKTYTCTSDDCGATKTESVAATGEHVWGEGEVTTSPTCVEDGVRTFTCDCGETKTEVIEATGEHVWDESEVTTQPTCAEAGVMTYTCGCGETKTESIPATGDHTWDEGTVTREPTCTESGEKTAVCTVCGAEEDAVVIPAAGHTWNGQVCSACGEVRDLTFTDVDETGFYYDAMLWAVEKGITNGTSATTFSPGATCTRAQVVTFLWRAMGQPAAAGSSHAFTDVDAGAYYYEAMLWAVEKGITNGTSATTFSPEATCTRAQVVTFLWRAMGKPAAVNADHVFTDVDADAFCYEAMLWAVEKGVTNGTSAAAFSPNETCTRAQVVTFLKRTFG